MSGIELCMDCQDNIHYCGTCGEEMCLDHLVVKYKTIEEDDSDYCECCAATVLPIIVKENAKLCSCKEKEELYKETQDLGMTVFRLHELVREKEEKGASSAKCACSIQ